MNTVPPTAAINWFKKGWQVFSSDMITWLLIAVLFAVIMFVLMIIPAIGPIIWYLIAPALMGGLMLAAKETLSEDGRPEVEHLFAGLTNEKTRTPMLILGAILLGASIVIGILGIGAVGSLAAVANGGGGALGGLGFGAGLLMLVVSILIGAAYFFAPAQVMFGDTAPVDAIKNSFSASLKNIPAMALFGVIYIVLSVIAAIPLGLGFLVLIPVLVGALYAAYVDVF